LKHFLLANSRTYVRGERLSLPLKRDVRLATLGRLARLPVGNIAASTRRPVRIQAEVCAYNSRSGAALAVREPPCLPWCKRRDATSRDKHHYLVMPSCKDGALAA